MNAIYRGFDQAALDREYNARASVPDFSAEYAAYVASSQEAMTALKRIPDLVYDQTSGETLDLYPAADGAPVFLWIHGGYWRALSKEDNAFPATGLTAHGVAVAVMNYTLAPAASIDEIVRQVRAAAAWLHHYGGGYGLDTRRIHIGGSSAGGHLGGMLLTGDWHHDAGVPQDLIASALLLSGLFDLEPLVQTHINAWMRLDTETAHRNSPQDLIPNASMTQLIMSAGGRETSEFKRQTADFARAWKDAGHMCRVVPMAEHNHFNLALSLRDEDGPLVKAIIEAITSQARPQAARTKT